MLSGELEESNVEIFNTDTAERRRLYVAKQFDDAITRAGRIADALETIRDYGKSMTHEAIVEMARKALERTTECPTSPTKAR